MRALRARLPREFPGTTFYFLPADIVSQILNFGLPAPIDVQLVGTNIEANRQFADRMLDQLRHVPGLADLRIQQAFDQPKLHVSRDRTKAAESGFTQRDVANSLLVSLSGSFQTQPTFWLNPENGVSYNVVTQTPQYDIQSLQDLRNMPLTARRTGNAGNPGDVASISAATGWESVDHYNIQRVVDIYGAVDGRDLGERRATMWSGSWTPTASSLPRGSEIVIRGQLETMRTSFIGPAGRAGLRDRAGVPADRGQLPVLARSVHHHHGAARRAGGHRAVSVLHAHHAERSRADGRHHVHGRGHGQQHSGGQLRQGACWQNTAIRCRPRWRPAFTRFRPVLMTALAMIIGMVPMALGLGEGGEQNAPLGRAVIGGLLCATVATLFFVPAVFSLLHGAAPQPAVRTRRVPHDEIVDRKRQAQHEPATAAAAAPLACPPRAAAGLRGGGAAVALFGDPFGHRDRASKPTRR